MQDILDSILPYYIIKVGTLYYVGGLFRESKENNAKSFEFSTVEEVAFPILFEEVANNLANQIGGIVLKREKTSREICVLSDKNKEYIHSESAVWNNQLRCIKKELL